MSLKNGPLLANEWFSRSMIQFKAGSAVDGEYMLPSDRSGGMATASAGESAVFGTWNENCLPVATHTFNASVQDVTGDEVEVLFDIQQAPQSRVVGTTGTFSVSNLDNSSADIDPTVGNVVLDKGAMPSLTVGYNSPGMTFDRDLVTFADGSTSSSLFYDKSHIGAWALFESTTGGSTYIFGHDDTQFKQWTPGEGSNPTALNGYAAAIGINLTNVAEGSYRVKYWSIGWWDGGSTEAQDGFCGIGEIRAELVELNVHVVPEPASLLMLVGSGLFLIRRAKSRS